MVGNLVDAVNNDKNGLPLLPCLNENALCFVLEFLV